MSVSAERASAAGLWRFTAAEVEHVDWNANEIIPGLWVGALSAAECAPALEARGIKSIVTVAARLNACVPPSIRHTTVALDDHPCADLLSALVVVLQAIDEGMAPAADSIKNAACGGVLVHCASGVSRSVASCVAWLMTRQGRTLDESLALVRSARPAADPNLGFRSALQVLERCCGDLAAARAAWSASNAHEARDRAQRLREAANALHSRADQLEEDLARLAHGSVPLELTARLEALQLDVDAASEHERDDPVARSIRRAAAQKVARLLGSA